MSLNYSTFSGSINYISVTFNTPEFSKHFNSKYGKGIFLPFPPLTHFFPTTIIKIKFNWVSGQNLD